MKIVKLKLQRNALRTNIKKQLTIGDNIVSDEDIDNLQILVVIKKLENYKVELKSYNDQILDALEDEQEMMNEVEESALFDERIVDLLAVLTVMNKGFTQISVGVNQRQPELIEIEKERLEIEKQKLEIEKRKLQVPPRETSVRLPKLEIKSFDGNVLLWCEFWDTFEKSVHEKSNLSSIEKFSYLKSKLNGEAERAICGLQLSSDNYDIAIDMLKSRFGNKQRIVTFHYNQLIEMQPCSMQTSKLRCTYDELEKNFRSLSALGEDIDQHVFTPMITKKLPREILRDLELKRDGEAWSTNDLRKSLGKLILAREASEFHVSDNSAIKKNENFNQNSEKKQAKYSDNSSTAEALVVGEVFYKRKCIFCEFSNHFSDECKKFGTIYERKIKLKNRCFICLRDSHLSTECKSRQYCVHCGESGQHHRSLCTKKFQQGKNMNYGNKISEKKEPEKVMIASGEKVIMQAFVATIRNPINNREIKANIFLDTGSHRTYVVEKMAKNLDLSRKKKEEIPILVFGSHNIKKVQTTVTEFELLFKDGSSLLMKSNVIPSITGKIQKPSSRDTISNFLWRNLDLAETWPNEGASIDILVGNDYYLDITLPERVFLKDGLYLIASRCGWMLSGREEDIPKQTTMMALNGESQVSEYSLFSFSPNVETFWNIETIGIKDEVSDPSEENIMQEFKEEIKYENGRYQVKWPWKNYEKDNLASNYFLAKGRFSSLVKKLKKDESLFSKYDFILKEQEEKGIIERDFVEQNGTKHYLPHHPVITPNKETTKIRIVYDASAKVRSEENSLNDCLHRGPLILKDLCGLLIRFRLNKIAIVADIEKAFLQIGLQEMERDVTRFFWMKNIQNNLDNQNLITYRFCRVPFGIISSPFLLSATISYHMENSKSYIAEKLVRDIYVDNIVTGAKSVHDAKQVYIEAKNIFKEAAMNLREWNSNSEEFMKNVSECDKMKEKIVSVLGLKWNTREDYLSISCLKNIEENLTKRIVLKIIASIYDPLGYFSPIIVRAKIFFQDLWKKSLDWDDELSEELKRIWKRIQIDLERIHQFKVPRFIGFNEDFQENKSKLMCFCDASDKAYAAVVYLVNSCGNEKDSNLVFAKSRLAPTKKMTIPRLELLAVVIGVRAINFVENELPFGISEKIIFSDSQCVLQWIQSKKKLPTFVENRVKEIRQYEDIIHSYISTTNNPADLPTRGVQLDAIPNLWWHGPEIIHYHINKNWVTIDENTEELEICMAQIEVKKEEIKTPFGINEENYSSLIRLLRITAWCGRFFDICRRKTHLKGSLTSDELRKAKLRWELYSQEYGFKDTLDSMRKNGACELQKQLNLFIDENGLMRCRSRLSEADIPERAKFPLLLPRKSHFTGLIIYNFHVRTFHSGIAHTLLQVRQEYWIPRGRTEVKSVLKLCQICRRHEGGPYAPPPMPPLPGKRVTRSIPFSYTGLDYLGPLYIRTKDGQEKVWICLFTCMAVRAVHLEIVCNMSSEEFLLCLRRFIATCGKPLEITLDNAPQFKLVKDVCDRAWKAVVLNTDIKNFTANEGIRWKFITELAPWMGGFYERLVGLVKRSLRKSIGRISLSMSQLHTIVTEIESMINSRPLVYVNDEVENVIITPSDFFVSSALKGTPDLYNKNEDDDATYKPKFDSADELLLTWKKGQKHLDRFWKIWNEEYLLSLRERTQQILKGSKNKCHQEPKVGDVVLVKENLPRGSWRLGRIERLIPSRDKLLRSAIVKIPSGRTLTRSIIHLYPIECSSDGDTANLKESLDKEKSKQSVDDPMKRNSRASAIEARKKFRDQL